MIELRGRLVVPGTPGRRAVDGDDGALVAGKHHALRVVGIDPELVVIVAPRRALDRRPALAPVGRPVERRVRDVDDVGVLRIDGDLAEVPAASPDAVVARHQRPRRAGIIRAVKPALLGVDDGVHAAGVVGATARPMRPTASAGRPAVSGCQVVPPSVDL